MEKFQKAPFEEIAAHCESKVPNQHIFKQAAFLKTFWWVNGGFSSGQHAARPAGTNLRAHNQVRLFYTYVGQNSAP